MKGTWGLKCVIVGLGSLQIYSVHIIGNKITQKPLPFSVISLLEVVNYNLKSNNCRFIVLLCIWFI